MNFFILSWNVRGIGRAEKRMQIKDIVNSSSLEMILLLETKFRSMSQTLLRQICLFGLVNGICLPSRGPIGGICLVWDSGKIEIF